MQSNITCKVSEALDAGMNASKQWHDLSFKILDHVSDLCKTGKWLELPETEREWFTNLIKSL